MLETCAECESAAFLPLYPACRDCRERPAYRTRQKAIGARPALAWRQCCAKHKPGTKYDGHEVIPCVS